MPPPMINDSEQDLEITLAQLRLQHRELDALIAQTPPYDLLLLQRLKKRKLALKDQITHLENKLLPDIIA